MSHEIISSPRLFQIWSYTTSHSELLLRSTKAPGQTTRVDVLFKNVAAIGLPTAFEGLTVSEATDEQQAQVLEQLGIEKPRAQKTYIVRGAAFTGYVIAGLVACHEDEGDYYDPSYFTPKPN